MRMVVAVAATAIIGTRITLRFIAPADATESKKATGPAIRSKIGSKRAMGIYKTSLSAALPNPFKRALAMGPYAMPKRL